MNVPACSKEQHHLGRPLFRGLWLSWGNQLFTSNQEKDPNRHCSSNNNEGLYIEGGMKGLRTHIFKGHTHVNMNSLWTVVPHLCDRQLQLDHVLRLRHRRLQSCVQEQDAIQVLPASHCIVVHKKHLVHCRKVLTPDTAARFSCERNRGQQTVWRKGGWNEGYISTWNTVKLHVSLVDCTLRE